MSRTASGTIVLEAQRLGPERLERLAGGAIIPGHLLEVDAAEAWIVHSVADGAMLSGPIVAVETQTPDDDDDFSIDVPYASGDTAYAVYGQPGDILYMWLINGSAAAVEGRTPLVSQGDGTLKVAVIGAGTLVNAVVGYPAEDVDNSGGAAAVRLRVRIV